MYCSHITENQAAIFFKNEPKVCFDGLPDNELLALYHTGKWKNYNESEMLGVFERNKLIAILRYSIFTMCSYNVHLYVAHKYIKSIKYRTIVNTVKQWMADNLEFKKLVVLSPTPCRQVHRACRLFGFKKEGEIKDVIIWRNNLENLVILGYDLREFE